MQGGAAKRVGVAGITRCADDGERVLIGKCDDAERPQEKEGDSSN